MLGGVGLTMLLRLQDPALLAKVHLVHSFSLSLLLFHHDHHHLQGKETRHLAVLQGTTGHGRP